MKREPNSDPNTLSWVKQIASGKLLHPRGAQLVLSGDLEQRDGGRGWEGCSRGMRYMHPYG